MTSTNLVHYINLINTEIILLRGQLVHLHKSLKHGPSGPGALQGLIHLKHVLIRSPVKKSVTPDFFNLIHFVNYIISSIDKVKSLTH